MRFPVPWSTRRSWTFPLCYDRPLFLRPFDLYCNACFGILFVSILCTCCSQFFWYCFISFTIFCAPVFSKKFPVFNGTRRFITAFTSTRHLSLSWANSIHSIPPCPTSWRFSLILSFHLCLGLPSVLLLLLFYYYYYYCRFGGARAMYNSCGYL